MDAFWRDSIGGIAAAAARTAEELQPHINNHLDKARESLEGVAAAASKTAEELRPHIDEHMQQAGKTLEGMAAAASKTAEELRPHIDEHMQQAGKTLEDIATAAAKTFEDAKPHVKHHLEQFEGSLKGTTAACIESLEMTKIACEAHIKNMPTKEEFVSSAKLGGDRFIEEVHKIRIEWTKLPEAAKQNVVKSLPTEDQFRKAFEDAKHKFSNLVQGFRNVEWEKLPEAAKEHIKKNPRMTGAVQIALLLVTLCPGLVMGPALLLLGFGRLGPVAGLAAPAFQSAFGTPLVFRVLQSAAMGGWGASLVGSVVSIGSLVVNGAVGLMRKKSIDEDKSVEEKKGQVELQ